MVFDLSSLSASLYRAIIMNSDYFVVRSFSSALSLVIPFLGLASERDNINAGFLVIWLLAQVVNAIAMWLK